MAVINLYGGSNLAQGLANAAQVAARPNFEMRFALLQNALIDRVNKKIEEVNSDKTNNIDAFMVLERSRLTRVTDELGKFKDDVNRTYAGALQMNTDLQDLDALVDDAASDPEAFNTLLARINQTADLTKPINGIAVGIVDDGGVTALRRDGVVQVTRDGAPVKVTSYADFADVDEARAAIADALSRTLAVVERTGSTLDIAKLQLEDAKVQLSSVRLAISTEQLAADAEKQQKVKELENEYAQLLNNLSVMFEGQMAISEQFGASLLNPPQLDKGSVINMFT